MESDCDIDINHLGMMALVETFPYCPEGGGFNLEELATQHLQNEDCSTAEVVNFPDTLCKEDEAMIDEELQAMRDKVGAANQVLPLITAVYENDLSGVSNGGLISEYRAALQNECPDSRKCLVCDSVFLSPTKLFHHAVSRHKINDGLRELLRCFVCRQLFVFGQALLSHLQEFHGLPSPHLTCCVCYTQLTSRSELKAHTRKHEQTEKCTQCFAHFASKYQLNEHTDTLHAKPFPCKRCRQGYNHETVLQLHEALHTKVETWLCECGCHTNEDTNDPELSVIQHLQGCNPDRLDVLLESLISEIDSHAHLDNLLSSYQQKSQPMCSSTNQCVEDIATSVSELVPAAPLQSVLSENDGVIQNAELICQLCKNYQKVTQCSYENVEQHMMSSHPRAKLCPFCKKRFSSASRARSHAQRHARSLENIHIMPQEFQCDHCDKKFTSKGRLHYHLEQQHEIAVVDKPYECPACPRKFLYPILRDKHYACHTKVNRLAHLPDLSNLAEIYRCQYCQSKFIKPSFLRRHETKYHPKRADGTVETQHFQCQYCTEDFESLYKMRHHIVNKHGPAADKQRYQCPHCSIGCRTAVGMRTHLRVHTGERPYKCSLCDKAFKRTQNLTAHMRSLHYQKSDTTSAEKLFHCASCDVQLKQRSSIIKHFLHVHRQFRRFICGLCGKRFSENQQLRYHTLTTHQIRAPAISTTSRQEQTQVYVWPKIEKVSSDLSIQISKIVEEEKRKTELVPDFQVTKMKPSEKPHLDGSGNKLKQQFNDDKAIVEQNVDKKLASQWQSSTTIVASSVPDSCMENQDLLYINDAESTLIGQDEISFNIDDHPSTQDTKASSLEKNPFPNTTSSCVSNMNRDATLEIGSSVFKTTLTVNSNGLVPLLICDPLTSNPQQDLPTRQPANCGSECLSTATTSLSSDTSTLMVDKTEAINNINKYSKSFAIDLPQSSDIDVQPTTSSEIQNKKILRCDICDKYFLDSKRLLRHSKTHTGIHKFACSICKKTFLEHYNLTVHMRTHTGLRPFQCKECGKTMRYHQEFEDHKRVHRGEKPYLCPECPERSFVRARDFTRHVNSKHQPSNTRWPCSLCTKKFSRKDAMETHIKKIHNRELCPTFQCTVCEHKFLTDNLLQKHRLLHSGHKGHVCTRCGKSFATKAYLTKHLRWHELKKFNIPCPSCPRTFKSQEHVMIHLKSFHDKNAMQMKLRLQAQDRHSESYSPGIQTSDCFVRVDTRDNLEAELDLTQLQQLGPVEGDKDIHVVFLQVLSDAANL